MTKFLRKASFFGGLLLAVLGIVIMLMKNDTGEHPEELVVFTTLLVFVVGFSLILYLIKNRGIS
ncbi:MAG: hypothetical protein KI790_19520 [Cyclobacteriaceae bacterium]|nr:hypothetical protein [Cyclobacteriaceae bacterium HetDA_MAG_MS6]